MSERTELDTPRRTRRSDGEATRARILEAAGELFGAGGYGQTTSKAVASLARVDLASINYHFDSRDGLYQAVLIEAHRRFISLEDLQPIAEADLSAEEKLRALIDLLIGRYSSATQWSGPVLLRELASPSSHIVALREKEVLPKLRIVLSILGEITGIAADEPALLFCLISVAAPIAMFLLAGSRAPWITHPMSIVSPDGLAEHMHRFALAGLHATSRAHTDAR